MSNKDSKNPFDLLLEDMTRTTTMQKLDEKPVSSGLNFGSLLKANNKRKDDRKMVSGHAVVYGSDGQILSRAVLREISVGGLSAELHPVVIEARQKVSIELAGAGAALGRVPCTVSRVAKIQGHPKGNQVVGLQFEDNSPAFKSKVEKVVKALSAATIPRG